MDMFPMESDIHLILSCHVETVCLLSKLHEEIKKYVAEYNDGMKVSDSCRVESGIICMECKKR